MNYFFNSPPPVKYKGLKNQGATCYLNSVLQVLFMTDDFREAVERYHGTDYIDHQLQSLFGKLRDQTTDTFDITKKLDIKQVYEQQDAAEYFEKILNLTSREASQIFHGELTHSTICSGCGTHEATDGQFWHLPLTLVDSCGEYSVVKGIEDYFKASAFFGENQMYCEQCDDKRDATLQCVVKHHPEVLMLLLKRFELDYYSMTYFKINCTVNIPCTLQIPANQTYELYAVVDHVGDLRSGHYSACIQSQEDNRWYTFNDTWVTQAKFQPFQSDNFEKSNSAYLLFYRKKSAPEEDIREESAPGGCSRSTSDVEESQDAVMANGGERVDIDRVTAGSEEELKLPLPRCHVEELENRDWQGNREENNESNDSLLQLQDREKEEVKTAPDTEEVFDRSVEAEKTEDVSRESLREESDENQDYESKKQDDVSKKRQQGHIGTPSFDRMSEQEVINTHVRQECPPEVCVDMQIKNEGNVIEGKRDKDRDERRERREKGRHQDNEGKDEVGKGMKVDPEGRRGGGEDAKFYREVKQEGETGVKGDRKAATKVKSGADRSQKLDPADEIQEDLWVREGGEVQRAKEQKRKDKELPKGRVTDKGSSGDDGQERAHPVHEDVKRTPSERTQDRDRSSHGRAAPVGSRSLSEGRGEVRKRQKREKQAESEEGVVEEKHLLKESGTSKGEEKKGTPSGIQKGQDLEEITLETGKRKRKRSGIEKLFQRISLHSRPKKMKIAPETDIEAPDTETPEKLGAETPEQAAAATHERKKRKWRLSSAKKCRKNKKKRDKTPSCFSFLKRNQTSKSDQDEIPQFIQDEAL